MSVKLMLMISRVRSVTLYPAETHTLSSRGSWNSSRSHHSLLRAWGDWSGSSMEPSQRPPWAGEEARDRCFSRLTIRGKAVVSQGQVLK